MYWKLYCSISLNNLRWIHIKCYWLYVMIIISKDLLTILECFMNFLIWISAIRFWETRYDNIFFYDSFLILIKVLKYLLNTFIKINFFLFEVWWKISFFSNENLVVHILFMHIDDINRFIKLFWESFSYLLCFTRFNFNKGVFTAINCLFNRVELVPTERNIG